LEAFISVIAAIFMAEVAFSLSENIGVPSLDILEIMTAAAP